MSTDQGQVGSLWSSPGVRGYLQPLLIRPPQGRWAACLIVLHGALKWSSWLIQELRESGASPGKDLLPLGKHPNVRQEQNTGNKFISLYLP